jgi:Fic family protein
MTSQRTSLRTQPWTTSTVDLRDVPSRFWIVLGECQAKCEHITSVPLLPESASRLRRIYFAKGALATTAIEGNTLSENEALRHLEGTLELPPSRKYLAREIGNIVAACDGMLREIAGGTVPGITPERIQELNRIVLEGLDLEDGVAPGETREIFLYEDGVRGAPAEDCPFLLETLCSWLESPDFQGGDDLRIVYAIIRAVLAHLYIVLIHPFGDGNGRTARLMEFQILVSSGVPAVSAHLLSDHYNLTRSEYRRQVDRVEKTGNVIPFIQYAAQGFLDSLRAQIGAVREQQGDIAWQNYIHEYFRSLTSESDERRRRLVLDLSLREKPIPLADIPLISTRLAQAYSGKNERTVSRDLEFLIAAGMVEKGKNGFRAKREIILAFRSATAEKESPEGGFPITPA